MTCIRFEQLSDDYWRGRLPPLLLAACHQHASVCADCREFLERYRQVVSLLREERRKV